MGMKKVNNNDKVKNVRYVYVSIRGWIIKGIVKLFKWKELL